jgi:hypothetical protein
VKREPRPRGPSPWQTVLEMQRGMYEAGDGQALLAAAALCLTELEPAPEWVQQAFIAALQRYSRGEALTLDAAFGLTRQKKGEHSVAARRQRFFGLGVAGNVYAAKRAGLGTKAAIQQTARQYGLGTTTVTKYWNAHGARIEQHMAELAARAAREFDAFVAHLKETEPDLQKRQTAIARYKREMRAG